MILKPEVHARFSSVVVEVSSYTDHVRFVQYTAMIQVRTPLGALSEFVRYSVVVQLQR